MELGTRLRLLVKPRVLDNLARCAERIVSQRRGFIAGLEEFPDSPRCLACPEIMVHALFWCVKVRPLWTYVNEMIARIAPQDYIELDVGYVIDGVLPPWPRRERMMFCLILAMARQVIWTTRLKEFYDGEPLTDHNLIQFFKQQLKVKIRCDHDVR